MRKDKKWALLAQHIDRSMIREAIAYELSRPYFDGVPQIRFCEVILNDIYYGVYVLSEQPTRKRLHLTKTKNTADASGSYLLYFSRPQEADFTADVKLPSFEAHYPFQIKYPDEEDMDESRQRWLTTRFTDMVAAINDTTSESYREYIDEQSFIDFQLTNEFAHNTDAFFCSAYIYKDADDVDSTFKMHLWDMDHAFGMGNEPGYSYHNTWVYSKRSVFGFAGWWINLMKHPSYSEGLHDRWQEYRQGGYSDEHIEFVIDSLYNMLVGSGAIKRNNRAWKLWDEKGTHGNYPPHVKYLSDSYEDEVQYIKDWAKLRLQWMDEQLK